MYDASVAIDVVAAVATVVIAYRPIEPWTVLLAAAVALALAAALVGGSELAQSRRRSV